MEIIRMINNGIKDIEDSDGRTFCMSEKSELSFCCEFWEYVWVVSFTLYAIINIMITAMRREIMIHIAFSTPFPIILST